jgi:mannose-6-phosphate isomerase-like protein (cupin superfamily)
MAASWLAAISATKDVAVTTNILETGGPPAESVARDEGRSVFLGRVEVRHIVDEAGAQGRFSVLEHPMSPRALASALHRHHTEDEYSFIIEGHVGALLGDEVIYGGLGDFMFKPRAHRHTFRNAGEEPAPILEMSSVAGLEQFFDELADFGGVANVSAETLTDLCARYALEMDVGSIAELCSRFDVKSPVEVSDC